MISAEVQELVRREPEKFIYSGRGILLTSIADSPEDLISLTWHQTGDKLSTAKTRTVTVSAGMKYGDLAKYLHENGFALHNLASLPHISVAGACATATHGSGMNNGNLSTSVAGLGNINFKW
jgi:alditol oxidase